MCFRITLRPFNHAHGMLPGSRRILFIIILLDEITNEILILLAHPVSCSHGFSNKFPLSAYEKMVGVRSDGIAVRDLSIFIEKNG
jgi:hypothetical protein